MLSGPTVANFTKPYVKPMKHANKKRDIHVSTTFGGGVSPVVSGPQHRIVPEWLVDHLPSMQIQSGLLSAQMGC